MNKRNSVLVFLGLVALFLGSWTVMRATGTEITACVSKTGSISILSEGAICKPQETLLTWNIVGPKGDKGDQGEPGIGSVKLYLRDANQQDLGLLLSMHSIESSSKYQYYAYLESLDVGVEFSEEFGTVKRLGTSGAIYFAERDCQGPVMYGDMTSSRQLSERMFDGATYRGKSTGPKDGSTLSLQSSINRTQPCQNFQPQGVGRTLFETEKIILPFSEPVSLPFTIIEQ